MFHCVSEVMGAEMGAEVGAEMVKWQPQLRYPWVPEEAGGRCSKEVDGEGDKRMSVRRW